MGSTRSGLVLIVLAELSWAMASGGAAETVPGMVPVPGGELVMGAEVEADHSPPHTVQVSSFVLDVHEVTNAEYGKFCADTGRGMPQFWGVDRFSSGQGFPDHPVVGVTWHDARAFCEWRGLRLPTEAEWEHAAGGGLEGRKYPWGDEIGPEKANYSPSDGPMAVKSFDPNGYGLHDMAGNVGEWVADWYDPGYYAVSPAVDPKGPESGKYKSVRGGGWHSGPYCNRVDRRLGLLAYWVDINVGFRCAGDMPSPSPLDVAFEKTISGPGLARGVDVAQTTDGGYVVVGVADGTGSSGEDVLLLKVSASGEEIWRKTYGGSNDDAGWSVHETSLGDLLVAGFTRSLGAGGFDCYLIQTDKDGELDWSRTFGGSEDDRCWDMVPVLSGGFALVGETQNGSAGEEDCLLVRTDATGQEVWSRHYGAQKSDRCFSLAETSDGGFLLVGATYSHGAGDRDAFIIKTDAQGREEWSRTHGGQESDVAHSVAHTDDGSFLITGYTTSFARDLDDPYLILLDADGQTRWTRVLPLPGVSRTLTGQEAPDGGFFLSGFSLNPVAGESAALVVKTHADGRIHWTRELYPVAAGQSLAYTVRGTPSGGCITIGHTSPDPDSGLDLFVTRLSPR